MWIRAENSATGESFEGEAENLTDEDILELTDYRIPALAQDQCERAVNDYINNVDLPGVEDGKQAEARAKLYEISKTFIYVGNKVIYVGRKLLDCVLDALDYTLKEYPNTAFGAIFGTIVGFLVPAIPVLGVVLGVLVAAIVAIIGFWHDSEDKNLKREIQRAKLRSKGASRSFKNLRTT